MAEILVIAEHTGGEIADLTHEMIGAAASLKEKLGARVAVAVIGQKDGGLAQKVNLQGVDEVLEVEAASDFFDGPLYKKAACDLVAARRSRFLILPHSVNGMAFGPSAAAALGAGFAADVMGLDVRDGRLVAVRSAYENKVHMEVSFPGKPIVALMLRGATFPAVSEPGAATITPTALEGGSPEASWAHVEYIEAPQSDIDITKAEFILSIGRGIQDEENVARFAALAERLQATLGCSRPLADAGWLDKPHQVGLSGKMAANCKLYLALGISGAVQHLHGMKHVENIIAVNTDPSAPIFNVAKYGVCADVFAFADALEKQFQGEL